MKFVPDAAEAVMHTRGRAVMGTYAPRIPSSVLDHMRRSVVGTGSQSSHGMIEYGISDASRPHSSAHNAIVADARFKREDAGGAGTLPQAVPSCAPSRVLRSVDEGSVPDVLLETERALRYARSAV